MRPGFAKDYPEDADLLALVDAFEAGNYRAVRAGVARIEAGAEKSAGVKKAARNLRSRTEPSRTQLLLLAITAALVVVLSGYEIALHGGDSRAPDPPAPKPTVEHIR